LRLGENHGADSARVVLQNAAHVLHHFPIFNLSRETRERCQSLSFVTCQAQGELAYDVVRKQRPAEEATSLFQTRCRSEWMMKTPSYARVVRKGDRRGRAKDLGILIWSDGSADVALHRWRAVWHCARGGCVPQFGSRLRNNPSIEAMRRTQSAAAPLPLV